MLNIVSMPEASPPRRGRPPQISREQIVAAARSVPCEQLTMKAIADALGVSRKALHYHVGDKEGLLNLVVADLFEAELANINLPAADWRLVLRAWARAFRDGVLQVGVPGTYIQLHGMAGMTAMKLTERVLQSLFDAGFDEALARRGLNVMSNVAMMHANIGLIKAQHQGMYPPEAELADVLGQSMAEEFPALRRMLAVVQNEAPDDQFEFELDLAIAGLARLLDSA